MKRFLGLLLVALLHSPLASYAQEGANDNHQPQRYKVGDHYKANGLEGVVFEVDASGQHGKIVSLKESTARMEWAVNRQDQKRFIGADSRDDGKANQTVVQALSGWQERFPPFVWCADLGKDWYLPSIRELMLFAKHGEVNATVNRTLEKLGAKQLAKPGDLRWYWSSTELPINKKKRIAMVYCIYVSDIYWRSDWKYRHCYVRAVAQF
ncbi:MAG: hypothetical protein IJN55_05800 [Alistipes sp.]|nr:hypothetical protein [Alistipes sp.]